jgi:hypothetical protein
MTEPKVQTRQVWIIIDANSAPWSETYNREKRRAESMAAYLNLVGEGKGQFHVQPATLSWTAPAKGKK